MGKLFGRKVESMQDELQSLKNSGVFEDEDHPAQKTGRKAASKASERDIKAGGKSGAITGINSDEYQKADESVLDEGKKYPEDSWGDESEKIDDCEYAEAEEDAALDEEKEEANVLEQRLGVAYGIAFMVIIISTVIFPFFETVSGPVVFIYILAWLMFVIVTSMKNEWNSKHPKNKIHVGVERDDKYYRQTRYENESTEEELEMDEEVRKKVDKALDMVDRMGRR